MTITGLILGVNLGGNVLTWTHPIVITSLVVFGVAAVILFFVERKASLPILPIQFLSVIPVANLMWSNLFASMLVNTIIFNVPLYLQAVQGTSPTTSGLYLVSPLVGASVTAILSGTYITITRRMKPPMIVGTSFLFCGGIAVSCLSSDTRTGVVPYLIPWASIGQGFFFPATIIAVLALNSQDEQAVVTTTLGLIRNLGSILGVAISSWVLQNALLVYLNKCVKAADAATKDRIIRTVRESIRSIRDLDPEHKKQVIDAYALSLRATFLTGLIFGALCICLVWPINLPRLQRQEDMDKRDAGDFVPADGVIEEIEGDEDVDEQPLLVTRSLSIHRTRTRGTRRSTSSMTGESPIERRASFETHF